MSVCLNELLAHTDNFLSASCIQDYCPNGLQVQGRPHVRKIVSGVTASQEFLDAAIAAGADMVLVHHGYFWKGEDPRLVGMKYRRLRTLIQNDVSLVAYHLPLDMHPEVGNNVQLAQRLGLILDSTLEPHNPASVGNVGHFEHALTAEELTQRIVQVLDRAPLVVDTGKPIKTLALCTGGAQGYIDKALAIGADAYLTGEVSEHTIHFARENGISFFAAGHHATERYGVQALGDYLAKTFDVDHVFIDCDNPV